MIARESEMKKTDFEKSDKAAVNKKNTIVVVLARNFGTGISVVRSLGAAGYTVDLVSNASNPDKTGISGSSKYIRNYIEVVAKKTNRYGDVKFMDVLLSYKAAEGNKPVLFPTDDYTVSVIDRNRHLLEDTFIMPTAGDGHENCIVYLMDKTVKSRLAKAAGLNVPKEWVLTLSGDCRIPNDMVYPCFCKPTESIMGYKRELVKCDDEKALKAHFEFLRGRLPNRKVLIQEFLNIEQEIDLSGVCTGDKVIIPAVIRKTAVSRHETGVTLSGVVEPVEYAGDTLEKVKAMLMDTKYVGMFDLELNIANGKIYFNELNLRSGGPNYAYFASGINLPDLFVKTVTGQYHTPEEECVKETGKTFVYEKVAWEDYIFGYINRRQLKKCIKGNEVKLLNIADDPEPGRIYAETVQKTARKRRLKMKIRPLIIFCKHLRRYIRGIPQEKKKNRRSVNSRFPRILIVGKNSSTNLTMARSFGRAGYEVEVLRLVAKKPPKNDPLNKFMPDAFSRYIKAYYTCITGGDSLKAYMKIMSLVEPERKMLLVPADDQAASVIDEYYDDLKYYYLTQSINGKSGEVNKLMSKAEQNKVAQAAGLPTLGQVVISTHNGEFEVPDGIYFPCFAKPDVSMLHSKSIMRRSDSKEELNNHIYSISRKRDRDMLVERYIEIKNEYSLLGVCDGEIAFGPAIFTVEEYGKGARKGIAVSGRILSIKKQRPELQSFVADLNRLVETIGFKGLYDIDFVEDETGNFYFVELNMRFGASGCAFTECGVNLPGMYADLMLQGKSLDTSLVPDKEGLVFVNEKELLHDYLNGILTKHELLKKIDDADITFIKKDNDSRAFNHFIKILRWN